MKYFDAPVPGGKISAENLRNIYDEVRRGNNFTVEGATLHNGVGGSQLNIDQRKEFWGRITAVGTGGRYSWEQVEPNASGTGWLTSESQFKGSSTYNPAIEAGLSASVAVGTIVRLSGPFYGYAISDNTPEFYIFQSGGGVSNASMIKITGPINQYSFICQEITGATGMPLTGNYTLGSSYTAYIVNHNWVSPAPSNNYRVSYFPIEDYLNDTIIGRIFLGYKINGIYFFWSDEADPPAQLVAIPISSPESQATYTMQAANHVAYVGTIVGGSMPTSAFPMYLINPNQDGDFTLYRKYIAVRMGWRTVTSGYWYGSWANYKLPVYAAHPFAPGGIISSPTPTGSLPTYVSP